ncbi:MAG: DUF1801 domain-containing protein [Bacteroidales bacterium]
MSEVDEYIESFPDNVRTILTRIRRIILDHAADAVESFAYKMPAYKTFGRPLVYFAGFRNHVGLYANPTGYKEFERELVGYKHGKGSVQFLLHKEIPWDLIERIVAFLVEENKSSVKSRS